jgi:cysteinyl-tRNA synthetase
LGPSEKKGATEDFGWIEEAIAARAEAKKVKDFQRADAIREELWNKGIELQDTVDGTKWHRRLMPIELESQ